jgi:hypothetical protein
LLDRLFPGGREAALRARRFADTLLSGGASVALIFVPPQPAEVCVGPDWQAAGRAALHGKVIDAANAAYKRAEYDLQDDDGLVRVTCYHKTANLLRAGDVLSAGGWLLCQNESRHLLQMLLQPERILWWETAKAQSAEESSS